MILLLDIGNTNINIAVADKNKILAKWRISTIHNRTADEYIALITQLMSNNKIKPSNIKDVAICSVVPPIMMHINKMCQSLFGVSAKSVGKELKANLQVKIDNPSEVGADRLVNAVGVAKLYGVPAIVVDFGTATTFDIIDGKGDYCGGVISPGVNLSLRALHEFAARLPSVPVEKTDKVIGKNTKDAMQSGVYWGYVGLIEGLLQRIKTEMKCKPVVVATGGLAPLFAEGTKMIEHIDADLTIIGLLEIYNNQKTAKKLKRVS